MIRYARLSVLACLGLAVTAPPLPPRTAWAAEPAPRPEYISLGEFTINLPLKDGTMAYAIIGITIDVVPAAASDLRAVEPRLKEAVMRRLMAMADSGVLQPQHTDLAAVKQALMTSIAELQPGSVRDVLIVRLLYVSYCTELTVDALTRRPSASCNCQAPPVPCCTLATVPLLVSVPADCDWPTVAAAVLVPTSATLY